MKDYIQERAVEVANYIVDTKATVRQTAKKFGISKSTVHTVVTKWNAFGGESNRIIKACRNEEFLQAFCDMSK